MIFYIASWKYRGKLRQDSLRKAGSPAIHVTVEERTAMREDYAVTSVKHQDLVAK